MRDRELPLSQGIAYEFEASYEHDTATEGEKRQYQPDYEASYEHDTATPDKRQYQPDFHLPDHGIYIESSNNRAGSTRSRDCSRRSCNTSRAPGCPSQKSPNARHPSLTASGRKRSWPCSGRYSSAIRNR